MMTGLQTLSQWKEYFGDPESTTLGLMNAVFPLGKVVSLPFVMFLSDRFGRKLQLVVGLVTCVAFAITRGLARSYGTFVAARFCLGFFTSFISRPSPSKSLPLVDMAPYLD